MTKILTLQSLVLLLALMGFVSPEAKAQTKGAGDYLMELESHITWEAVDEGWRTRRAPWVAAVKAANNDGAKVAKLLAEFESHVKWEAVDQGWRTRRAGWVTEVAAANNSAKAAKLLAELESHIQWSAVDQGWRTSRDPWVRGVGTVR